MLKYYAYLIKHKAWMFCALARRGLVWRAITHDLDKLALSTAWVYRNFYNGKVNKAELDDILEIQKQHRFRHDHHPEYPLTVTAAALLERRLDVILSWRQRKA